MSIPQQILLERFSKQNQGKNYLTRTRQSSKDFGNWWNILITVIVNCYAMKKILFSCLLVLFTSICFAQKQKTSVIELTNGSVIRGVLLESAEGTVKIQTYDHSVFVFPSSEIVTITESANDTQSVKTEHSIIISGVYAMNLLKDVFNVPNYGEVSIGYFFDINIPKSSLFF